MTHYIIYFLIIDINPTTDILDIHMTEISTDICVLHILSIYFLYNVNKHKS